MPDRQLVAGRRSGCALARRRPRLARSIEQALPTVLTATHGFDVDTPLAERSSPRHASNCCAATAEVSLGMLTLLEKQYATATEAAKRGAAGSVSRRGALCRLAADRGCGPKPERADSAAKAIHEITALPVEPARRSSRRLEFDEEDQPDQPRRW